MMERCGARGGVSSYFVSRYVAVRRAACLCALPASQCMRRAVVDSDGFIGRRAITAGRSTARRRLTVPLVSYAAISARNAKLFFVRLAYKPSRFHPRGRESPL